MITATPPPNGQAHGSQEPRDPGLWRVAIDLEATFLSLMLKDSGIGEVGAFGGGEGEEQFSSFLRDAYAHEMAEAGGIGLAESLYRALEARSDAS